jgi:hypothetical protein
MNKASILFLCFAAIMTYVTSVAIPKAIAENEKCWFVSHEMSAQNEVANYLNLRHIEKFTVLHSYRDGLKWNVVYQQDCK